MSTLLHHHARAARDLDFCSGSKRGPPPPSPSPSRSSSVSTESTSPLSIHSSSDFSSDFSVSDRASLSTPASASAQARIAARKARSKHRDGVVRLRDAAWRAWIAFVGCWGVGVMEPWEACFAILVYTTVLALTLFALWQLPSYLAFALHRLAFYLTGRDVSLRHALGRGLASLVRAVGAVIVPPRELGDGDGPAWARGVAKATARAVLSGGGGGRGNFSEVLGAGAAQDGG